MVTFLHRADSQARVAEAAAQLVAQRAQLDTVSGLVAAQHAQLESLLAEGAEASELAAASQRQAAAAADEEAAAAFISSHALTAPRLVAGNGPVNRQPGAIVGGAPHIHAAPDNGVYRGQEREPESRARPEPAFVVSSAAVSNQGVPLGTESSGGVSSLHVPLMVMPVTVAVGGAGGSPDGTGPADGHRAALGGKLPQQPMLRGAVKYPGVLNLAVT
jgi:hypothetical protein